jgi:hypothetical protein
VINCVKTNHLNFIKKPVQLLEQVSYDKYIYKILSIIITLAKLHYFIVTFHCPTTDVAKAFPRTFVALRNISQNGQLAKLMRYLQLEYQTFHIAATTTKLALGTPAIPLLVSIKTKSIVSS